MPATRPKYVRALAPELRLLAPSDNPPASYALFHFLFPRSEKGKELCSPTTSLRPSICGHTTAHGVNERLITTAPLTPPILGLVKSNYSVASSYS